MIVTESQDQGLVLVRSNFDQILICGSSVFPLYSTDTVDIDLSHRESVGSCFLPVSLLSRGERLVARMP